MADRMSLYAHLHCIYSLHNYRITTTPSIFICGSFCKENKVMHLSNLQNNIWKILFSGYICILYYIYILTFVYKTSLKKLKFLNHWNAIILSLSIMIWWYLIVDSAGLSTRWTSFHIFELRWNTNACTWLYTSINSIQTKPISNAPCNFMSLWSLNGSKGPVLTYVTQTIVHNTLIDATSKTPKLSAYTKTLV